LPSRCVRRQVYPLRSFSISHTFYKDETKGQVSPLRVFVDTFKAELKKSQELQDNLKMLSDESDKLAESPQYKSAKSAYIKAKERADAASSSSSQYIKAAGEKVGHAVAEAWESDIGRAGRKAIGGAARGVGRVLDEGTKPVRDSQVYKTVSKNVGEVIDDGSSSRYGGYLEKAERRTAREAWLEKTHHLRVAADENAGQSVVMHKDSKWKESWDSFKASSPVWGRLSSLNQSYNESENSFISAVRRVTDSVTDFFTTENEMATVVRMTKGLDPSFTTENFLKELREFILPEVLDAYVKGDGETLRLWLADAPYAIWSASNKVYTQQGLQSDGLVRDIRHVDLISSRIMDNDIPVFIVAFRSQETHLYRNVKSGEITAGVEDKISLVSNAAAFVRLESEMLNVETRGWR
jgi:import inner membrane translocase subunit TIM44